MFTFDKARCAEATFSQNQLPTGTGNAASCRKYARQGNIIPKELKKVREGVGVLNLAKYNGVNTP